MRKNLLVILFMIGFTKLSAQATWDLQSTIFPAGYTVVTGMSTIDDNNVWAYSNNTTTYKIGLSKTINGSTWNSTGELPYNSELRLTAFEAQSAMNASALLVNTIDFSSGLLVKTTNGGSTWSVGTTTATFPDFVHFFDVNNGVIVCDSNSTSYIIYKTNDGGINWNLVNMANLPTFISDEFFLTNSYRYYQNAMWFTTNKGRFFKTTNQGASWVAIQSPYNSGYIGTAVSLNANFYLVDTDTAYILNGTGQISKTINGGLAWSNTGNTSNTGTQSICKIPNTNVLLSNGTTNSKYSTDEGLNWTVIDNTFKTEIKSTSLNGTYTIGSNNLYKLNANTLSRNDGSKFETKDKLIIFPNPSSVSISISTTNNIKTINIIDIFGKKTNVANFGNNIIDVSGLQNGIYFIEITTEKGLQIQKFIKN